MNIFEFQKKFDRKFAYVRIWILTFSMSDPDPVKNRPDPQHGLIYLFLPSNTRAVILLLDLYSFLSQLFKHEQYVCLQECINVFIQKSNR
jgi:hypothetical protein